jgi:hypothetical protein
MKNLFFAGLLTVFLVPCLRLSAQNIAYRYDNAGNRISREINPLRSSTEASSLESLADFTLNNSIKLYPNPTNGILTVEISGLLEVEQGEIRILDTSGRTVKYSESIAPQNTFDLSGQANGIYLLRISLNDETKTWKIIKH